MDMNEIQQQQIGIIPSIQELTAIHPEATYEVQERDILVHVEDLPYSFTFSYFERFGWQAFLVPKESLIEEDFSHILYEKLQSIATTYNKSMRIFEKPETALFSFQ
jgi:hypothetical protein